MGQHLDAHRRVLFGRRLHDLSGSVGAPVVDEDHLMVEVLAGEIALDLLDGAREPLLLVVARDDHAQHGSGDLTWGSAEP